MYLQQGPWDALTSCDHSAYRSLYLGNYARSHTKGARQRWLLRGLLRGVLGFKGGYGADAPNVRGAQVPGVVFLKYRGGIFENISEKCGIFVICHS